MAAKPAGISVNADDEDCEPSEGGRGASASPACTGATSLTKRAVAAAEGSRSGRFEALFIKAKLTPTVAAAASASPPPISFQLPGLSLVDFCRAGRGPTDISAFALTGRPPSLSICDRPFSRPGEMDLAAVDAELAERPAQALRPPPPASTPRACLQRSLAASGRPAWLEVLQVRFLSPPRDVLLPPVPSRRWLIILVRTAHTSANGSFSSSC